MLQLNALDKLVEKKKRVGRGGKRGRYCGRGKEGQKSRTGSTGEIKAYFEGGQMPLIRRIPRRGFVNSFKLSFEIVNLSELEGRFVENEVVSRETLSEKGLIKGRTDRLIKVLGMGTLTKKLTVNVNAISKAAAEAIQKAGGSVQLI